MRVVNIARPPVQARCAIRKFGDMLAGAAAEFQNVSILWFQKRGNCRPDRFVIAVKGGTVQPAICRRLAIFAILNNKFDHGYSRTHCKTLLGTPLCYGQRPASETGGWRRRTTGPPSLFLGA